MTPQEIWWKAYFAALSGVCDIGSDEEAVVTLAVRVADETISRLVAADGSVYSPRPSDWGVG